MIMGGMGWNEIDYWSKTGYNSLIAQLGRNEPLIKVKLPGRKRMKGKKPYYTFLGQDAKKALKDYLKHREQVVSEITRDIIFITSRGKPITYPSLSQTWRRIVRRLELIPERRSGTHHRYGKSTHELRDFYRTRWEKSPASKNVGEYLMGHTIDKLGYNKAYLDQEYMKMEYFKAEPFLNVISQDPTKISQYELIQQQKDHNDQLAILASSYEKAMETISTLQKLVTESTKPL
jgi:integrase